LVLLPKEIDSIIYLRAEGMDNLDEIILAHKATLEEEVIVYTEKNPCRK
jgi:hypothetical protein